MMNLQPDDLHVLFTRTRGGWGVIGVWNARHEELFSCPGYNRTVKDGQYGHWGNCPPGEFLLGRPEPKNTIPFGPWFVPVIDYADHYTLLDFHRSGIGIHGGGSGLAYPFKDNQGWIPTEGCIRLQNIDLRRLVTLIQESREAGGRVYFTVAASMSKATSQEETMATEIPALKVVDPFKYVGLIEAIIEEEAAIEGLSVGATTQTPILKGVKIGSREYDYGPVPLKRTK